MGLFYGLVKSSDVERAHEAGHTSEIDLIASLQNCILIFPIIGLDTVSLIIASSIWNPFTISTSVIINEHKSYIKCTQRKISGLRRPWVEIGTEVRFIVMLSHKLSAIRICFAYASDSNGRVPSGHFPYLVP